MDSFSLCDCARVLYLSGLSQTIISDGVARMNVIIRSRSDSFKVGEYQAVPLGNDSH